MKKFAFTILLSSSTFFTYSQIQYEPGYFIDNRGNKIDCLIKNTDRTNNPVQFEYRLSENAVTKIATIDSVQEFGILNTIHRYVRANVLIDRSSDKIQNLDNKYSPALHEERLFLRVTLVGNASLYSYYDSNGFKRFFYSINNSPIEQLIYKKYLTKNNGVSENITFRQQLWNSLKCKELSEKDMSRIPYTDKGLLPVFAKYNQCVNADYKNYFSQESKGKFIITPKAGVNTSTLEIYQTIIFEFTNSSGIDVSRKIVYKSRFSPTISPQIGMELEYNFSSNKHKWSIFFDPAIQYFKDTYSFRNYNQNGVPSMPGAPGSQIGELKVNYVHFILPVGVKHFFFLNATSQLSVSGAMAYSALVNPSKTFEAENVSIKPKFEPSRFNIFPFGIVGIGYRLKNRYSIEASYQVGKAMSDNPEWSIKLRNSFSLMLGYRLK